MFYFSLFGVFLLLFMVYHCLKWNVFMTLNLNCKIFVGGVGEKIGEIGTVDSIMCKLALLGRIWTGSPEKIE